VKKNPLPDGANSLAEMRKFLIPSYLIATIVYLGFSLHYFTTGLGGTMLLAVTLVPIAYVLWVLNSFVAGELPYPRLGLKPNIAIACAMFGRFIENKGDNILLRAALALACIVVMYHPNGNIAMVVAAFVLPATFIGVRRHRVIAQPKSELKPQSVS
jgi:hypothetical protein